MISNAAQFVQTVSVRKRRERERQWAAHAVFLRDIGQVGEAERYEALITASRRYVARQGTR